MARLVDVDSLCEDIRETLNEYLELGLYSHSVLTLGFLRYIEKQPSHDSNDPIYVDLDTSISEAFDLMDPKLVTSRKATFKNGELIYNLKEF